MQKLFTLLSTALLVLATNVLFAQNCPANPTYKNTSGTYDLTASGLSYAVNNGSTVNVTIQNGFSTTSAICVTNGSTLNLAFQNLNNPVAGGVIYVDGTSKLNLTGGNVNNFPFTITNYGTITQNVNYTLIDGAVLNNNGTIATSKTVTFNSGSVVVNNSGTMLFTVAAKFNNGNFTINNTATGTITLGANEVFSTLNLVNKGTIKCVGALTLQGATAVYNSGTISISSPGTLSISKADLTNYGILEAQDKVVFNQDAVVANYCSLIFGKDFTNNGVITNSGKILLKPDNIGSIFINQGTLTNGTNGFVQGYDFSNNSGSISGGGNFYFTGTTKNQSAFSGSNGNFINFYDATPCSVSGQSCTVNSIFDVTNTAAANTTKTIVAPVVSSTVTACGDPTPPTILVQPQTQSFCDSATKTATFSVVASTPSYSSMTYQWRNNGVNIPGATSSSYTVNNLKAADTANKYAVAITNSVGTTISNNASVNYVIASQPANAYVPTGNPINFNIKTSAATAIQWFKGTTAITSATNSIYSLSTVNLNDKGKYYAVITYAGGTCTTNAATLDVTTILYSKASGDLNAAATWGVLTDGNGSAPIDFTRDEHTFVIANRNNLTNSSNITIAGKVDLSNGTLTIAPGTTLTVGRIVRTGTAGVISGSAKSSLTVQGITTVPYAGSSDLYFKDGANVLQYLTIAAHAVTLHGALNIVAGKNPGILKVNSGSFNTSDSLTLKSDSLGTAIVGTSLGSINGKVTIERYVPARRAWRLMCAPVTSTNAPTINAAWQEGATSSTDNPHPGFGTHITYGSTADGFDQNPQKTFSMYYYSADNWVGIPATNKTLVNQYPAYFIFIRGDRSYNITTTTSGVAPHATVLRTFGNLNQGQQPAVQANSTGFTLVANPYASPINFEQVYNSSSNIKNTIRVWDPSLAGSLGVGAYVTLDWDGTSYKATPPSAMTSIIQPYQAFFVQSNADAAGKININEAAKNIVTVTNPFGKKTGRQVNDATLEVNLKVFNADSTTGITDGVLYRFNDDLNNSVDEDDVTKFNNLYENLSIQSNNALLTIERRQLPQANDTLHLYLSGIKSTNYQLEFVPGLINKNMFLYDNYLKTLSPINITDTTRFTININTANVLSKATNRFSIVMQNQVVLPVTFNSVKAYAKGKTVQVEWQVASETEVQHYEIEKSANGTIFNKAGQVKATGATTYSFNDGAPFNGTSYYRIKSVDNSGKVTYTKILPVTIDNNTAASSLAIYPNPLKGKTFQVQMSNKAAGTYTLMLVSNSGQQLFTQSINYNGGTVIYNVALKQALASGLYFIKATATDGSTDVIKAIVQ